MLLVLLECIIPFFLIFKTFSKAESLRPGNWSSSRCCAPWPDGRRFSCCLSSTSTGPHHRCGRGFRWKNGIPGGRDDHTESNILFSQWPWTPWQMFVMGIIGFWLGSCSTKGVVTLQKGVVCVWGADRHPDLRQHHKFRLRHDLVRRTEPGYYPDLLYLRLPYGLHIRGGYLTVSVFCRRTYAGKPGWGQG